MWFINLVGGWPTPLKYMSSSIGMMTFPTEWKMRHVPNHQPETNVHIHGGAPPCTYVVSVLHPGWHCAAAPCAWPQLAPLNHHWIETGQKGFKKSQELSEIIPNYPKLSEIVQKHPKLSEIVQNRPKVSKIFHALPQQRSPKIMAFCTKNLRSSVGRMTKKGTS